MLPLLPTSRENRWILLLRDYGGQCSNIAPKTHVGGGNVAELTLFNDWPEAIKVVALTASGSHTGMQMLHYLRQRGIGTYHLTASKEGYRHCM